MEGNLIPQVAHILPRINAFGEIVGWRSCAATIPGCVVILQDHDKALEMIVDAIKAITEDDCERNAN